MTRLRVSFLALAAASLLATGCAFEHSSATLSPSPTDSGANPGGSASLVGLWTSRALPTLPSPDTCGNFQFEISSQTATSVTGRFSATCGGGVAISGTASGRLNGLSVELDVAATATAPGIPSCSIALNGVGSITDGGNTLTIPYSGTTCLGAVSGTEVLHRPT